MNKQIFLCSRHRLVLLYWISFQSYKCNTVSVIFT